MTFYPSDRIALFIDGPTLYAAAKSSDIAIDYKKLLEAFNSRGRLIRASYYTTLNDGDDYAPVRPLIDWLQYNGYRLVTKPAREYIDTRGQRHWRGDMDIEIACDMLEMAGRVDHAVLFSGQAKFCRLVEAVRRKGTRVTIVSSAHASPSIVSDEMRRQADGYIDIKDLAPSIGRPRSAPNTAGRLQV